MGGRRPGRARGERQAKGSRGQLSTCGPTELDRTGLECEARGLRRRPGLPGRGVASSARAGPPNWTELDWSAKCGGSGGARGCPAAVAAPPLPQHAPWHGLAWRSCAWTTWRRRWTAACLQPCTEARRWAVRTPWRAWRTSPAWTGSWPASTSRVRAWKLRPRPPQRAAAVGTGERYQPLKLLASPAAALCVLSTGEVTVLPVASGSMANVRACAGCTATAARAPGGCFPAPQQLAPSQLRCLRTHALTSPGRPACYDRPPGEEAKGAVPVELVPRAPLLPPSARTSASPTRCPVYSSLAPSLDTRPA